MRRRSLPEWLRWQESLHPKWIELELGRVREVAERMAVDRPAGPVFTVAGTNGKGSTANLLAAFLRASGHRVGLYTSPHLVAYNERVSIDGKSCSDRQLIAAFECVEAARSGTPLTFFEFGTLAALEVFRAAACDAWVLEVGMGGRLDAVNIVDPDFALITTIGLDHQEFLGETVEQIAREKAGILRAGRQGFYGDWPVPGAIREVADRIGAQLNSLGHEYDFTPAVPAWNWRGRKMAIESLAWPKGATAAQLRNISLALAALESFDPVLLKPAGGIDKLIAAARPPGRFQVHEREQQWVLDVAHNPQAIATLRAQLDTLPAVDDCSIVIGALADKQLGAFPAALGGLATRWLACGVDDPRARSDVDVADQLRAAGASNVAACGTVDEALARAQQATPSGGRVVVCGSFRVVGPALRWLGIY